MKEFCLALLNAINQFYAMKEGQTYVVGSLIYKGNLYSFAIGHRGRFQKMTKNGITEWFDLAGTPRKYTAIIYEGKRYEKEPTINFEST